MMSAKPSPLTSPAEAPTTLPPLNLNPLLPSSDPTSILAGNCGMTFPHQSPDLATRSGRVRAAAFTRFQASAQTDYHGLDAARSTRVARAWIAFARRRPPYTNTKSLG